MFYKKISVLKKVSEFSPQKFTTARLSFLGSGAWTSTIHFGDLTQKAFTNLSYSSKHAQSNLFKNMKLTDLMSGHRPDSGNRFRIKRRTIGGNTQHYQTTRRKNHIHLSEKSKDVFLFRIPIQNFISDSFAVNTINNEQYTKRSIINFISSKISRKISQSPVKVFTSYLSSAFFFQRPQSNSAPWQKAQIPGGLAINAKRHSDMVTRLLLPALTPWRLPYEYNETREELNR